MEAASPHLGSLAGIGMKKMSDRKRGNEGGAEKRRHRE